MHIWPFTHTTTYIVNFPTVIVIGVIESIVVIIYVNYIISSTNTIISNTCVLLEDQWLPEEDL